MTLHYPVPATEPAPEPGTTCDTASALRLGVEEEFLLVDTSTGRLAPYAEAVLAAVPEGADLDLQCELTSAQVETATVPHTDTSRLRRDLVRSRRLVASLADHTGCAVVASGSAVVGSSLAPLTAKPRYQRMAREYGVLLDGEGVCGCHVHVEMPDRETAILVSNHIRPYLPVLQAVSANSPFEGGRDTGYASWRAMAWSRWPAAGPPPYFPSADDYEALVEALIASGALLDRAMVYWFARPSEKVPTLEIRAGDVAPTAEEAALLAALVRGLAATALAEIRAGIPAPPVPDELLRAAHWRAARDGLEGEAMDVLAGRRVPAWALVEATVDRIRPALGEAGDLPLVTDVLAKLRERGSGAARQRAAYARRSQLTDVVSMLVAQTVESP